MKKTDNSNSNFKQSNRRVLIYIVVAAAILLGLCALIAMLILPGNGRTFPVYINEVLASNTRYPNDDGRCCDYVELYNSADYAVDLSGYELGDIGGNKRYVFPVGTVMEPHSYLVVYCDKTVTDGTYAPFGISRAGGESIYLLTTNHVAADQVETIETGLDQSMVRLENGEWGLSDQITPGRNNSEPSQTGMAVYNPAVSPVRITELSASNSAYCAQAGALCDWVEMHNTSEKPVDISGFILSDNTNNNKYSIPEGTMLPAGGYLVVYCNDSVKNGAVAPFGLSQLGGEYVVLKTDDGRIVEIVDCMAMGAGESQELGNDELWTVGKTGSPGYPNTDAGHEAYLQSIGGYGGTVAISEVMAANKSFVADTQGRFSDWIEICNTGSETVNLAGWFLSDDPNEPLKWEFPQVMLEPGQRTVVYCSGRDGVIDGQLHTDFSLAASGETILISSYAGTSVDSVTYVAAEDNCSFVYDTADAEPVQTRFPTPGYPNDEGGYTQFCDKAAYAGPLAISGVMTSNDWYLPQDLGICYDWVEMRNTSSETIRLSDYSITDDADVPQKYVLPDKMLAPGDTYVIILSGDTELTTSKNYHAGFSLNAAQDQLYLFDKNSSLVDYVALWDIPFGYSYGREDNQGGYFYMNPTPNAANSAGYRLISAMPTSEIQPGVYAAQTSVELPLEAIGDIFYTTDGSVPTTSSLRYTGPIQVNKTTVIRAVAVENGKLSSDIYTTTFIVQEPHDIPVVSLVMDPDDLWGPDGIYKYDIKVKEEKRAANLAYSGEDGSFSMNCEISLHGMTTVTAFEKKSFTLRFHDNYDGLLDYDLFGDGEVTKFRSLILRTAHESTFSSQMRDALLGHIASQSSDVMPAQKYRYVSLYINGEYWGLYALREHHSEEHYASYMNVPVSSVSKPIKFALPDNDLYEIYQFCQKRSCKYEQNYEYIKTRIDVNSFADWIIFEAYTGNIDINENMRYYYCSVDGLWRCALVDVDLGFFSQKGFPSVTKAWHHGEIPASLMQNEEFQRLVAKRLAELLEGPLSDENMIATIDMMADTIRNEAALDAERWGFYAHNWEKTVVGLRDYCDGRAVQLINSFCAEVGFTKQEKQEYFGHLLK